MNKTFGLRLDLELAARRTLGKEITALAIDKAGNIYAAGVGEKRPGATPTIFAPPMTTPTPAPTAAAVQPGMVVLNVSPTSSGLVSGIPLPGVGASGGSEIYRRSG